MNRPSAIVDTGTSNGIGQATAALLADRGRRVDAVCSLPAPEGTI